MSKWVKVQDGVVIFTQYSAPPDDNPLGLIEAPDWVINGYPYDGEKFLQRPTEFTLYYIAENGAWVFKADRCLNDKIFKISQSTGSVLYNLNDPYGEGESKTWSIQLWEATQYKENSSSSTPMLDNMVSSSNGIWTKDTLADKIIANADSWRAAVGDVLGQQKKLMQNVKTLHQQYVDGEISVADFASAETEIVVPTINIEDKY